MIRRVTLAMVLVALAFAFVAAGEMQKGTTGNASIEAMKAGMMKCYVCKHIAMHMDEYGPMGMEAVKLNDGLAIRHWVKNGDPKSVAALHAACEEANKAGQECMNFTDDQAKSQLCENCQAIRNAAKAGARVSNGETSNGDLMVLTSPDPAVQAQLAAMEQKCAMQAAMLETPSGGKQTAQKN